MSESNPGAIVRLSDLHFRLLALLHLGRAMTARGLAVETGVALDDVELVLSELEEVGLLAMHFSH